MYPKPHRRTRRRVRASFYASQPFVCVCVRCGAASVGCRLSRSRMRACSVSGKRVQLIALAVIPIIYGPDRFGATASKRLRRETRRVTRGKTTAPQRRDLRRIVFARVVCAKSHMNLIHVNPCIHARMIVDQTSTHTHTSGCTRHACHVLHLEYAFYAKFAVTELLIILSKFSPISVRAKPLAQRLTNFGAFASSQTLIFALKWRAS